MGELTYHQSLLLEKLEENRLDRDSSLDNIVDPLFQTIGVLIDEKGPMRLIDAASVFSPVLLIRGAAKSRDKEDLSNYISRCSTLLKDKYEINMITVRDALRLIYGKFDEIRHKGVGVKSRNKILYRSEESLRKYVMAHTSRKELVVIDCDFPLLKHKIY